MKKKLLFLLVISAMLALALPSMAFVWEPRTVSLPTFPVTVNEQEYNYNEYEKYPLFVYKDVTYFPLTYNNAMILNLIPTWNVETGSNEYLRGNPNEAKPFFRKEYSYNTEIKIAENTIRVDTFTYQIHHMKDTKNKPSFDYQYELREETCKTTIDGENICTLSDYPVLFYNDMVYIPLTYHFVTEVLFGTVSFDEEKGLEVRVDNYFTTLNGESSRTTGEGYIVSYTTVPNDTYYIRGDLSVFINTDSQRLIGPVFQNLTIKNGDKVIKPKAYFAYFGKNEPLFSVEYDKIRTTYYTDSEETGGRIPMPCLVDINTGEIAKI